MLIQYCLYVALIRGSRKTHMTKCILTRFDGVLEIVEPLLVFLPRDVYLDLLTGVQLRVAHAAVVLQVGGRPERSERVEMWLDAEKCIRCQSVGESGRPTLPFTRTIAIGRGAQCLQTQGNPPSGDLYGEPMYITPIIMQTKEATITTYPL